MTEFYFCFSCRRSYFFFARFHSAWLGLSWAVSWLSRFDQRHTHTHNFPDFSSFFYCWHRFPIHGSAACPSAFNEHWQRYWRKVTAAARNEMMAASIRAVTPYRGRVQPITFYFYSKWFFFIIVREREKLKLTLICIGPIVWDGHGIESFLSSILDSLCSLTGEGINKHPPQCCRCRNVDNLSAFDSNLSANGIENEPRWKPIDAENVLSVRVHTKKKHTQYVRSVNLYSNFIVSFVWFVSIVDGFAGGTRCSRALTLCSLRPFTVPFVLTFHEPQSEMWILVEVNKSN